MTNVTIDLTNFKDRVGSRVKPDTYRVVVDDAELDTARSGNQMINVWFRIVGGEFDGATITDRLVLTEKSMFRIVGFMQALGMPTPRKRLQLNLEKFKGKQMEITVDDGEPYNGRVKSEVRAYAKLPKSAKADEVDLDDDSNESEEVAEVETEETETPKRSTRKKKSEPEEDQGEVDLDSIETL